MAEYIDREKLKTQLTLESSLGHIKTLEDVERIVDFVSTADVAPVKHGKWMYENQTINTLARLKCSNCGWWTLDISVDTSYDYCPKCGAKMDGDINAAD